MVMAAETSAAAVGAPGSAPDTPVGVPEIYTPEIDTGVQMPVPKPAMAMVRATRASTAAVGAVGAGSSTPVGVPEIDTGTPEIDTGVQMTVQEPERAMVMAAETNAAAVGAPGSAPDTPIWPNRTESGSWALKPYRTRLLGADTEPNPAPGCRNRTESGTRALVTEPNPTPPWPEPNRIRTLDLQTEPGACRCSAERPRENCATGCFATRISHRDSGSEIQGLQPRICAPRLRTTAECALASAGALVRIGRD